MENEKVCTFSTTTRLCEKILDESWKHNHRSTSRTFRVKKLRTKAYSTLLIPGNNEFSLGPHDCFVKVISTAFENRILHDNVRLEEFNGCVDQLWRESSKQSWIPAMVYFLARMCNEGQDSHVDKNEAFYSRGLSSSFVPKKYHLYHPSSFILPNLHSAFSSGIKVNCLTNSQFWQNSSSARLVCNFQFDVISSKFSGRKIEHSPAAFPSVTRDQNDMEDEGYTSTGTTPLVTTPGEASALPWYELDLDLNSNQKTRHCTWESLGERVNSVETPPLFEAGVEAFHCTLKIQEKLLLTLEPRISFQFREPIKWKTFLYHVMCLLMGLESESFVFNKKLRMFGLVEGVWLEDISHEALSACLADIIVMGSCLRRLLSFVENGPNQGVVLQAIKESTRHYLHLYQGVCLLMMYDLQQTKSASVLLVRLRLRSLQEQILCLAKAYGLWGSGPPLPTGVEALSHLHRYASSAQRQQVASLFHYILHAGCLVYFSILERWVFDGEIIEGGDFFVVPKIEYLCCRNRRFWTRAFQFNTAAVPEFLFGLKPFLLRCGKSVNFLKSCDPKHPSLENGQSLLASLKQSCHPSLSSEELIKEYIDDLKLCQGNSFVESKVCLEKEEIKALVKEQASLESLECISCETGEELVERKEREQPISLDEDAKKSSENITEILECDSYEAREHLDGEMLVEKIIEEEKKKIKEYYKMLGKASDRRRFKAEWRSRRMKLRTGESTSCSITVAEKPDCGVLKEKLVVKEPFEKEFDVREATEDAASEEDMEEWRAAGMIEMDVQNSEIGSNDKPKFKLEVNEDVVLESLKVDGSEREMKDIIEIKVLNPVAEIDCIEDVDEIKRKKLDAENEAQHISDMPSSNMCLPFLKSPSRSLLKKPGFLFPFKTDCQSEEKANEQELPPEWPYRSILLALLVQSSKMDAALLQWILVEKGLVTHLRSLRAYFFLLDGEFGRRLSEDLFSAMRRAPGGKPSVECLSELSLSRILSHALASSTFAAADPNASLISLTLSKYPEKDQVGDPLACVHMQYKVPWPLNVVLTDEAVSKYSRVLDLLLRLKHASWALEQTFLHLRVLEPGKGIDKVFPRRWRSPYEAVQNSPQYHQLQLYRHQMMHLVRSVQSYITSGVLQASGKKLDEIIAGSSCLDEFYAEHVQYVKKILFGCMLNKHSETIANILNDLFRLIMKFHWSLCSRSWHIPSHQGNKRSCHFEHPNFNVLSRIHAAFEEMTDFLLKYAWRLASHGYQASLFELLQMINVNNFY